MADKNQPGWFKKIKLSKLDLSDGKKCVLGQTFKDFFVKVADELEVPEEDQLSFSKAVQLGFNLKDESEDLGNFTLKNHKYDLLTSLWYSRLQTYKRPR